MKTMSYRLKAAFVGVFALAALAPLSQAQRATTPPAAISTMPESAAAANTPPTAEPATATAGSVGTPALKSTKIGLDELSPISMFLKADIVVKVVMIALALASVATWTTLVAKSFEFSVLNRKLKDGLRRISNATSLGEAQLALGPAKSVLSSLLNAVLAEARLSAGLTSDEGLKERVASSCVEIVRAEARRVRTGMGLLATVGAISPFVGLFGTVWGIMNSFIGISKSQTTNLAVVAPGIAEALLATAIGLAAAIPAVIIYNHFSRVTKAYLELVNRASGAAARLLSRDLDRGHVSVHARAAE